MKHATDELRRRLGVAGFDGAIRAYAGIAGLFPATDPRRWDVEVTKDVAYGDDAGQRLDAYRPRQRGGPLPALVYAHGGGFSRLSKEIYWLVALTLARRGFVVFLVDHRLAPAHRFPAAHADVCRAALWVRANASRFGADGDRLAVAGDSTGANLVTALAVATAYRRPEPWAREVFEERLALRAVAASCGLLEVRNTARFRGAGLSRFTLDALDAVAAAYCPGGEPADELVDPLVVLERAEPPARALPPFLVAVGTADPLATETDRLERALHRLGAPCVARRYEGGVHGFHYLFPWQRRSARCWSDHHRFLRRHVRARVA